MEKYPSKVSIGLVLVVLAMLIGAPILFVSTLEWTALIMNIVVFALVMYFFFAIHYIIDEESLVIKIGFWTYQKVKIDDIDLISQSNSIVGAPAASFDRLNIISKQNQSIMISPRNKEDFLEHLKKLNPKIKVLD